MKKWWREPFIDRRAWILSNMEDLALNAEEAMVVLLIDFMNEHKLPINYEILSNKMKLNSEFVDDLITSLTAKGFLKIGFVDGKVNFLLDGIFEGNNDKQEVGLGSNLIDIFEEDFGRLLSSVEVERLSEWNATYDKKLIYYALREAMTNNKRSFDYIERILMEWKRRNFTCEDYEEGKR